MHTHDTHMVCTYTHADLITRGWTKWDAHTHSSTSVFKTTTVFYPGKYGFSLLPLSLQSAMYSCPHRTSQFLESVETTRTTTLAYNTQQTEISFSQSGAIFDTENLLHQSTLWFTAVVASSFKFVPLYLHMYLPQSRALNYGGGVPCVSMRNLVVSTLCLPLT